MAIVVSPGLTIPDRELSWTFGPSGGPGGQHANRSNTRVELTWDITTSSVVGEAMRARLVAKLGPVVRVVADDERSQLRNRTLAAARLAERIRGALVRPRPRRATSPTASSQRRRVEAKRQRSQTKDLRRRPDRDA